MKPNDCEFCAFAGQRPGVCDRCGNAGLHRMRDPDPAMRPVRLPPTSPLLVGVRRYQRLRNLRDWDSPIDDIGFGACGIGVADFG
jgi:hypothetical protein